jgi:hypothetical protein
VSLTINHNNCGQTRFARLARRGSGIGCVRLRGMRRGPLRGVVENDISNRTLIVRRPKHTAGYEAFLWRQAHELLVNAEERGWPSTCGLCGVAPQENPILSTPHLASRQGRSAAILVGAPQLVVGDDGRRRMSHDRRDHHPTRAS